MNKTLLAVAAILGLAMVAALVLIPIPQDQPLSEDSRSCIEARHFLSHQEGAMIQCSLTRNCQMTAQDYSKRDYYEENVMDVCPAPKAEPEPQPTFPDPAPAPTDHPPQEGSLKRDGFTADAVSSERTGGFVVKFEDGHWERYDSHGTLISKDWDSR